MYPDMCALESRYTAFAVMKDCRSEDRWTSIDFLCFVNHFSCPPSSLSVSRLRCVYLLPQASSTRLLFLMFYTKVQHSLPEKLLHLASMWMPITPLHVRPQAASKVMMHRKSWLGGVQLDRLCLFIFLVLRRRHGVVVSIHSLRFLGSEFESW